MIITNWLGLPQKAYGSTGIEAGDTIYNALSKSGYFSKWYPKKKKILVYSSSSLKLPTLQKTLYAVDCVLKYNPWFPEICEEKSPLGSWYIRLTDKISSSEKKGLLNLASKTNLATNHFTHQDSLNSLETKNSTKIPYPGERGEFVLKSGDWKFIDYGVPLVRELRFVSRKSSSLFNEVNILGYRNGLVGLCVKYKENDFEVIKNYFESLGLDMSKISSRQYIALFHKDVKTLYEILQENNSLPQEQLPLIRNLIEKGKWK